MTLSIRRFLPFAAVPLKLSVASIVRTDEIYATDGIAINEYDAVAYFSEHNR